MSLRAYQQAATRAENPREMEYRLFGQVTRALMDASKFRILIRRNATDIELYAIMKKLAGK